MRVLLLLFVLALVIPASASSYETPGARHAICVTFGRYCRQAITVATCESHLDIWAHNGQYLGLFQMGSSERSRWGHGNNAWAQARAAYRYFSYSLRHNGYGWQPWGCRPW